MKKIWTVRDASKILEIKPGALYARAYKAGILKKPQKPAMLLSDDDIEKLRVCVRQYQKRLAKV